MLNRLKTNILTLCRSPSYGPAVFFTRDIKKAAYISAEIAGLPPYTVPGIVPLLITPQIKLYGLT